MADRKPPDLPGPLRAATSALRGLPGAGAVGRVADGALNAVGAVSPRGRRLAVYTGAGILGVTGAVEWPVALTGAAVGWLTQPWPSEHAAAPGGTGHEGGTAHRGSTGREAGKHSATGGRSAASDWTGTAVRRHRGSD